LAIVGIDKNDHSVLIGTAYDEGFDFPVVHAKLEFVEVDGSFVPVLAFCPIIDEKKDEESQRNIAEKIKSLMIDEVKDNKIRIRWDPDGEFLGLMKLQNGSRRLIQWSKLEEILNKAKPKT